MPVERRKELEEVGCFCQMIQEGIARINHCERLWN
jgi:hypothetical protein